MAAGTAVVLFASIEPDTDRSSICKDQLTGDRRYMISGKYLRTTVMLSIMVLLSGFTACGSREPRSMEKAIWVLT